CGRLLSHFTSKILSILPLGNRNGAKKTYFIPTFLHFGKSGFTLLIRPSLNRSITFTVKCHSLCTHFTPYQLSNPLMNTLRGKHSSSLWSVGFSRFLAVPSMSSAQRFW